MNPTRSTQAIPALASTAALGLLLAAAPLHAQTTLFADNFDRADDSDLNASATGKSGSLGVLDWVAVVNAGSPQIFGNQFKFGENGAGGGWSVAYLDHNFTDAAISAGGAFTVTVDLVSAGGAGGTRFMGFAVGHSKAEMDAWSTNLPTSFDSDFFIGIDPTGTKELKIFKNGGTQDHQQGFTLTGTQNMSVAFTGISDFNSGSTVNYEAFIDGSSIKTGSFTWSGTDENYIGLYSNYTQNQAIMDNFAIQTNAVVEPLALKIAQVGGNLDFEWNSLSGMQYDLVSNTDLTTAPDSWLPYNDGVTTYENILSTGTSTQTLSGVLQVGPTRFFALIEEPVTPVFEEGFENGDGGFTPNIPPAGTPWTHGDPDSTGFGGQTVGTGNGGSTNCWGTDIGNPGHYLDPTTDSCLRSTVIDLSGVTAAELTFAQARDFPVGDTAVVNIIDESTGNPIVSGPFPLTVTDDDPNSANWADAGPYALPVGGEIRIEWCFSGTADTSDDYMGWYIDDVVVTPTTP